MSSFPALSKILRLLRGHISTLAVASHWVPSAALSMAEQPIASVSMAALSMAAVEPSILRTAAAP